VNYVPSKFSPALLASSTGPYRRKGRGRTDVPKLGGGIDAFRRGEARIGSSFDDDSLMKTGYGGGQRILRWTKFKWALFLANIALTCYSIAVMIACLMIWFDIFQHSEVMLVANKPELITSTLAASLGIVASVVGWAGILLNNRMFLAIYSFLLWAVFAALVTPGYLCYKRRTFNLEGKVNSQWSRDLDSTGRLRIQNSLQCCGYYSPFVEASISATCYSRSLLPGCKLDFLMFERFILKRWYIASFGLVPIHIMVILAGLLCSNHVTYRFGKGMTPKAYRLNMDTVAAIMDNYANELAELYGAGFADDVLHKSRSNLNLSSMASMPYSPIVSTPKRLSKGRYDSITMRRELEM
jgi:hypothetical protein